MVNGSGTEQRRFKHPSKHSKYNMIGWKSRYWYDQPECTSSPSDDNSCIMFCYLSRCNTAIEIHQSQACLWIGAENRQQGGKRNVGYQILNQWFSEFSSTLKRINHFVFFVCDIQKKKPQWQLYKISLLKWNVYSYRLTVIQDPWRPNSVMTSSDISWSVTWSDQQMIYSDTSRNLDVSHHETKYEYARNLDVSHHETKYEYAWKDLHTTCPWNSLM
jgi:hypothetical protein